MLQATDGQSGRVNSTWPLGWTGEVPLSRAIERVEAWYGARGRPAWFRLVEGKAGELRDMLERRGYAPDTPTLVMTAPLGKHRPDAEVAIHSEPSEAFFTPMREATPNPAEYAERRDVTVRTPSPRAFAMLSREGRPAAVGASVVTGDLALIFIMRTAPSAQRRGLARQVLRALMAWAREAGASAAYLQVEVANGPAVALYGSEGFATVYSYLYWRRRD